MAMTVFTRDKALYDFYCSVFGKGDWITFIDDTKQISTVVREPKGS